MPKKNNSQEYWAKRRQQDKIKVIKEGEKGIDNLKRLLKTNLDDVQVKIKNFYEKYGENPAEKMSYSEWQKYKAKLKRMAQQNPQDEFLQRLAKQNIPKYQIDRLRALELDLQMQLTEATNGQAQGIYNTLDDVARVSQSVLAKSMQASIGLKFNTIADKKLKQLLSSDWSGANWSDRLWHDRAVVGKKVTEILQKGVTQGTSLQKMARELKQATNQSFNNAFRLIRTETSHIDGQVTLEGYKQAEEELGLEYYEYDAFLDSRTSTLCRDLDKKRFKVSEAEVGINYPPMHPNCRSTTQLVLDEDYKQEEELTQQENKKNGLEEKEEQTKKELEKLNKKEEKEIKRIKDKKNLTKEETEKIFNKTQEFEVKRKELQKKLEEINKLKKVEEFKNANTVAGVKKGKKMTFEEANAGKANPNFEKRGGYIINCQSCVVAYEARLRGYNVQALPKLKGSMAEKLAYRTNLAWLEESTGNYASYMFDVKIDNNKKCVEWLDKIIKPNERYTFEFDIKGTKSGHIISVFRDKDNKITFYDPQSGEIVSGKKTIQKIKYYATSAGLKIPTPPKVMRIDDKIFNLDVVNQVLEASQ